MPQSCQKRHVPAQWRRGGARANGPATRKNRKGKRCTRLVGAGTLSFTGHAGKSIVRFQGRISRTRRAKPGRYVVKVTASDPTTPRRPSRRASFTIAKG
jgi:hypothetical protein